MMVAGLCFSSMGPKARVQMGVPGTPFSTCSKLRAIPEKASGLPVRAQSIPCQDPHTPPLPPPLGGECGEFKETATLSPLCGLWMEAYAVHWLLV